MFVYVCVCVFLPLTISFCRFDLNNLPPNISAVTFQYFAQYSQPFIIKYFTNRDFKGRFA